MVQITSKKAFKSAVLVTAAWGATGVQGAAIPAGQGSSVATLDVDASVLSLPDALPQKTFNIPNQGDGKQMWRGRLGRRGPWRNEKTPVNEVQNDYDLINLDLSSGPHSHHGSLVNIETVPSVEPRRHNEHDVIVVEDSHRHHGHDVEIHEHLHGKRRHDDVYYDDGYRGRHGWGRHDYDDHYHGHSHGHYHEHGHYHGDGVYFDKRHHGDDIVVIDGDRHGHHGHHRGHHGHHDVTDIHSHIHAHGDNINIVEKRRHGDDVVIIDEGRHHRHADNVIIHEHLHSKKHNRDTTIVKGGRHGTTVVDTGRHGATVIEGGRHGSTTVVEGGRHHDVTVLDKKDVIDVHHGGRHHHDKVVIVGDGHRHGGPVTVVSRANSDTSISSDGQGGEIVLDGEKEPTVHLGKRHSDRITVIDQRHPWHDTDVYYPHHGVAHGRPMYFGRGNGYNRIHMVDGPYLDHVRYGHHWNHGSPDGWYKRSHSDDRDGRDRKDRHDRHCRHGKCDESKTVITKRDNSVEMGGAPGYIDVTSPVNNSTTAARIASLVLSTTNGTESNSSFVLNASNNIRTQVYLVPANTTSNATAADAAAQPAKPDGPIRVNLKLPIFVAQSASVEPYCATFDPAPSNPGPLFVTKCMEEGSDPHSSQLFSYDPATGIIHPDWKPTPAAEAVLASVTDGVDDDEASMSAASAAEDDDVEPSAISPLAAASSASASASASAPPALNTTGPKTSTDSTSLDSKASNVTLIFTPVNPTVQTNVDYDDATEDDSAQAPLTAASGGEVESPEPDTEHPAQQMATMDARNWGYPGEYEDEPYRPSRYGAPMYDEYEGEGYSPYAGGEYEEERPNYTAPYDWQWTKTGDESVAAAPAATFA